MNYTDHDNQNGAVDWQQPLGAVSPELWDVLVVGAGPAGTFAASLLAGQGHKVLMVDRESFPREKVCGDCLLEDVFGYLEKMGALAAVRETAFPIRGITAFSPSGYEATIPGRHLTLRRRTFDTMLTRRAVEAGVTFCRGDIWSLTNHDGDLVQARDRKNDTTIRSKYAVITTGSHIGLADRLGLVADSKPSAVAMRCYVKSDCCDLDRIVLVYDKSVIPGYGWVVPIGNGEFNVGCGVYRRDFGRAGLKQMFETFTVQFPLARKLLEDGEVIQPVRGGALRCGLKGTHPLFGHRILVAGETLGSTLQFSGEGVGQAMATAELAAETIHKALVSGRPTVLLEYPQQLETRLRPVQSGYERAHKWASNRRVNDLVVRRIARSHYLRGVCTDFIARGSDPRPAYSVLALLKSFFR